MSANRDSDYQATFLREAAEILEELQTALLELESEPQDKALVDRVFRAMHTLKGSGSMFGFEALSRFTHEVETVFDQVRQGRLAVTRTLVDLGLSATDHVTRLLHDPASADPAQERTILEGLAALAGQSAADPQSPQAPQAAQPAGTHLFRIRFKPAADIFLTGTDPLGLLDELRDLADLGECRVILHAGNIPDLDQLDPERCHAWWDILLKTTADEAQVRDVFLFVADDAVLEVEDVLAGREGCDQEEYTRLGEILVDRADISTAELRESLESRPLIGQQLLEQGHISPEQLEAALAEQKMVRETRQETRQTAEASVRVEAGKLDALVDLVGELVIVQARLTQAAGRGGDPLLGAIAEDLERLSADLRDKALGLRMLPIGTTFGRFRRLVRDLSRELGKEAELVTSGGETELDKTMIERLGDPLVHMLRNSMDHGLESPQERAAAGKPTQGSIRLEACQSGGEVLIRIRDDGKGIDVEKLKAKALARGVNVAGMAEAELVNLIFEPGLSTARAVTSVSGRGVGMDVVRESVRALGGRIEVATGLGQGTTITIRLPLTMAIISGLEVRVGDGGFVIPLATVEECVELDNARAGHQELLEVRGQIVPFVRLDGWFGLGGPRPRLEQVVVVNHDGQRVGLVVQEVLGECQAVIKNLGPMYRNVRGVSGATVNGDGSMALIVDVGAVVAEAGGIRLAA